MVQLEKIFLFRHEIQENPIVTIMVANIIPRLSNICKQMWLLPMTRSNSTKYWNAFNISKPKFNIWNLDHFQYRLEGQEHGILLQ